MLRRPRPPCRAADLAARAWRFGRATRQRRLGYCLASNSPSFRPPSPSLAAPALRPSSSRLIALYCGYLLFVAVYCGLLRPFAQLAVCGWRGGLRPHALPGTRARTLTHPTHTHASHGLGSGRPTPSAALGGNNNNCARMSAARCLPRQRRRSAEPAAGR